MKKSHFLIPEVSQILRIKNYSSSTARSYMAAISDFLNRYPTDYSSRNSVLQYLASIDSPTVRKSSRSALIFFLKEVVFKDGTYFDIPTVSYTRSLKINHSYDRVKNDILKINNIKARCLLLLSIDLALRVSEVVNIQLSDINFQDRTILIKLSKYDISRTLKYSEFTSHLLLSYLQSYGPELFLFEVSRGVKHSHHFASYIFKSYLYYLPSFHSLRHLRLTFLCEQNINLAVIARFAGHKSLNSTLYYYHNQKTGSALPV